MLIYLDTNIWVYSYENNPEFGYSARQLFQSLQNGTHRLISSYFVLGELLVLPTRKANSFAVASYVRLFASPELTVLPYSVAAAEIYGNLRASHRIKPLDALHLATAASAGVDLFITEDTKLLALSVPGIGKISNTTASAL